MEYARAKVACATAGKEACGKSLAIYEGLKANSKLSGAEATESDELRAEIGKCDAALDA